MSKTIFVNRDKENRAAVIYDLVTDKRKPTSQGEEYNKVRYTELLSQDDVNLKNKDEAILAIYTILGGAHTTQEEVAEKKAQATKRKAYAKAVNDDDKDEGKSADDDDDKDDE